MLLHTAERQKRSFSYFCTLQKGKKEIFHASAHYRKTQKEDFRAWRKSFPEWFGISAHGESYFPKGLAFPRMAKVVSRKVWHFRAWRKSFPEGFGISAHGESRFPKGLAFPRMAKVISRKVWHFRARRKSFPKRFGISALGESHFPSGLAFPRTAKVISRRVWRARESFIYKERKDR